MRVVESKLETSSDYDLPGGKGDFQRGENALLLSVGLGQFCDRHIVAHHVVEQGKAAQRGMASGTVTA